MVGISYGSYSSAAGQLQYQAANSSKKSSRNGTYGTNVFHEERYIKT